MQLLKKIDSGLYALFNVLIVVTSLLMTGLVFFLVLARYLFGSAMIGTLEMATISALWLYMLGAIVASRNSEHLTVDFLEQTISSATLRASYEVIRSLIVFGLSIFVLWLAKDMLDWALKRPQTTPALEWPLLWQQASMLVATVFFVIYGLRDLLHAFALFKSAKGDA